MSKLLGLSLGASLAVLVAGAAQADMQSGEVVGKDTTRKTLTIETDAGTRYVYRVDETTQLMQEGDRIDLGQVDIGDRVQVSAPDPASAAEVRERIASRVEVQSAAGTAAADRADDPMARADDPETRRMAQADDAESRRLPSTASPLPMIGVVGMAAAGAGLLLRRMRR
jgi:hypothetical protein